MHSSQDHRVTLEEAEKAKAWVYEMYRMADTKNVGMIPTFLNDEAVLNFASVSSLKGRAEMERLFTWEYGACARIDHSIQEIRVSQEQIIVNLAVAYRFKNGSQQAMKYQAVWYKSPQDKRASRVDIDGDFSQVFQELTAVGGPPPI
ncbi:hypothetical protein BDZ97DRAFT_1919647 [Flammula alnicola]|nr:hypothetical protein BDZ97DRAFT_1919647 [Flammula alnicola]